MKIALIGAGNMGTALARGLREPVIVSDPARDRAEALASELRGEVAESSSDAARRADAIVLCHKPAHLGDVANETGAEAKAVVSILGGTAIADLEAAFPDRPVYRFMPNIPAEVRRGVLCYAPGRLAGEGPESELLELFGRVGTVIPLAEPLFEAATALMGCGPAFFALTVEALVDAGVRRGLAEGEATTMVVETMGGTAAVLHEGDDDAAALRRRVTSPRGLTERALAVLEQRKVREAFDEAVAAVVGERPG